MSDRVCATCKYDTRTSGHLPCKDCIPFGDERPYWESTTLEATEVTRVTDDKNISMIKSIIDKVMEKKDCSISIFIRDGDAHITVTPLGADEPRWIAKEGGYECSICGQWELNYSRYCRACGEALRRTEGEEDDH